MKILCMYDKTIFYLTISKWYEVIGEDDWSYLIINDRGIKWWCDKQWFKTQVEVREEKLGELGL